MNTLELSRVSDSTSEIARSIELTLEPIDRSTIPENVKEAFAERAGLVDAEATALSGLHSFSVFRYQDGSPSYLGKLGRRSDVHEEQNIILIETATGGKITGDGEIRCFTTSPGLPKMLGRLFVGRLETVHEFQRNGLGTRRLRAMGVIAFQAYGQALHSSTHLEPEDVSVWKKLVSKREAIKVKTDIGKDEYSFA